MVFDGLKKKMDVIEEDFKFIEKFIGEVFKIIDKVVKVGFFYRNKVGY